MQKLINIQYHRGRAARQERWVFGMCDTSVEPALGYMELVPDRTASTLLPIIQAHVRPGTDIQSDQWRAYNSVAQLPNVASHSTVNHSLNFVDPTTGVHTQNIESYWNRVKRKFKAMKGVSELQLPSYLDEFLWRERHGNTKREAFTNIIRDIANQYPLP